MAHRAADARAESAPEPAPGAEPIAAGERGLAVALLVALLALRVLYALHREFNSDEPQHLHVVWGWTRGLLPYRDVHDNHAPLFHLVMAPLLAAIGERASALVAMRFAMFPLFALVLAATGWLGSALFSARVGLWAMVLAAAWPQHFQSSLEFRADDLWAALWLLSLALLLSRPAGRMRALGAGLLAGAAAAASLKTSLLLVGLGAALALSAALDRVAPFAREPAARPGRWPGAAAEMASGHAPLATVAGWGLGFAVVPAALGAFFAARGAFAAMVNATVLGNALDGLGSGHPLRRLVFPVALLPALWIARHLAGNDPRGRRRAILFLSGAIYYLALVSYWPLQTPQNHLPVEPLAALTVAALLLGSEGAARGLGRWAPLALAALGIAVLVIGRPPWRDRTGPQRALIGDVLALTGRDEYVFDLKGESVFRRRPVPWVLETVTQERFRRGLLPDAIAADLAATRTAVAAPDHFKLPPRIRAFLNANYVGVGAVRVLGQRLAAGAVPPSGAPPVPRPFEIAIAERYLVLAGRRPAAGRLDGTACGGARWLAAGRHVYVPAGGEREWTVVWARAVEKGYAPPPLPSETP